MWTSRRLTKGPQAAAIQPIPNLPIILNYLYLQFFLIIFLTINPITHSINFPCGRKPENPDKTHDFRQSVNKLFSRAIRCSIYSDRTRDLSGERTPLGQLTTLCTSATNIFPVDPGLGGFMNMLAHLSHAHCFIVGSLHYTLLAGRKP